MELISIFGAFSTSRRIFTGNYQQLREVLLHFHDPAQARSTLDIEGWSGFNFRLSETVRLFHNFVAGSQTLVEHTRIMMRHESIRPDAKSVYDLKIKETFAQNELAGFVKDLRNYFIHRGIPDTALRMSRSFTEGAEHSRVIFDLRETKKLGWLARSQQEVH